MTARLKPLSSGPLSNVSPIFICAALFIQTVCLTRLFHRSAYQYPIPNAIHTSDTHNDTMTIPHSVPNSVNPGDALPQLFIYRRTKKTGSSSMLDALLRSLQKHGYKPLYHAVQSRMQDVVRSEMLRAQPPRLLIAQHNSVTRAQALGRSTVIADTVQDGYKQMTSFCRYVRNVKDCDAELEKCLLSAEARNQMTYRWAGREEEDEETYIDLPLSSGHPALSTTVLRHVFPDVTLDVKMWNVVGSSCEENANLRKVYKRYYRPLDKQVQMLRQRILYMTGYPSRSWPEDNLTLVDMLDAAERIERKKYDIRDYNESTKGVSRGHGELMQSEVRWHRFENGSFILGRPPKK